MVKYDSFGTCRNTASSILTIASWVLKLYGHFGASHYESKGPWHAISIDSMHSTLPCPQMDLFLVYNLRCRPHVATVRTSPRSAGSGRARAVRARVRAIGRLGQTSR